MQQALRNRLIYGSIMLAALMALLYFDHWIEAHTYGWVKAPNINSLDAYPGLPGSQFGLAGVGLLLLLMFLLPLATREAAQLFAAEQIRPYRFLAALGSGLLVVHAFLTQFPWFQHIAASTLAFIIVFTMILAALRRASGGHTEEAITHMAGTVLAMLYLGGLAWFIMALRVKHSADEV